MKLFESVSTTNKEDNDADQMRIFPSLLRKKARSWYNHKSSVPAGIDTWAKLREKFLRRFHELGYDSCVLKKLRNLQRKWKENLKDYTERFQDLLDQILKTGEGVYCSTQQAIDWYVTGLPQEMETYCGRSKCDTIDDVIILAEALETTTLNRRLKYRPFDERKSKSSQRRRRPSTPLSEESSSSEESSESEVLSSLEDER